MAERSRSPFPGMEQMQTEQQQIHKDIADIKAKLDTQHGRLNEIDQRSALTNSQLQKDQQLQASKQAIVTSWADSATATDRSKAVEDLLSKHGMLNRYASTTTLKTKQGIAPISIVEFFSKDARNEFLDMLRKDMLVCHGQIAVGRAQIPKYQREADQPLRCAIAVFSQCDGTRARYKPTWELSALWRSGEWVLIAEPNPKDRTDITLYIQQSKKELFATHFPEAWAQWGGQRTTNRRTDGYRPQDHFRISIQDMTPDKQTEYDEKYQTLHDTRKQNTSSNMEVEENSVRARQTKGSSKGQ